MSNTNGNVGRPVGFKVSEETKDRIRDKRLGSCHSEETKRKISESLSMYFKKRYSLSDDFLNEYGYTSREIREWVDSNLNRLDEMIDVVTNRRIMYIARWLELGTGDNTDKLGHELTPEFLLLIKEDMFDNDLLQELKLLNYLV
jgi:hypothetical protein